MFRLRQLFPGIFQVSASAPKLKTVIQKDVKVGITSAAEVNIVMEVQTGDVEEVRVVEKAPTVSTTTTNVKEVYDLDFVESMPFNSRDQVFNQMVDQIGGAVNGRIRGGAGNQTIMTQDGFDMRDQYPVTKASAAYEIQSAGYGADNATASGGVVNLVTKTGSNKWEFEFNATAENDTLRFGKDSRDSPGNYYYLANPAAGRPHHQGQALVRPRLRDALPRAGPARPTSRASCPRPRPHIKGINKGTLKLTWQMTPRNKLTFLNNFDSAWNVNMKSELGVEQEAQQNRKAGLSGLWGLIWESLLTDELVFRSQAAFSKRPQYWYPWACEDGRLGDCDVTPGVINKFPRRVELTGTAVGCTGTGECSGASGVPHRRDDLYVYQTFNQLQYFLDSKALGEHSFVLKHQFYTEDEVQKRAQPGDYYDEYLGAVPEARTTFFSNDPRQEQARYGWWIGSDTLTRNDGSGQRRLAAHPPPDPDPGAQLRLGLRHEQRRRHGDRQQGLGPQRHHRLGRHPRRPHGRPRQLQPVRRRGHPDAGAAHAGLARSSSAACGTPAPSSSTATANTAAGPAATPSGCPAAPPASTSTAATCREALTIPRTYEYTMGAEREIVQGVALGLDLVYRQFNNQYEQRETNRIWDEAGTRDHRLPQRPQRDGHRHGHARRRHPLLPGRHRSASTSARAAAACTSRTP